MEPVVGGFAGPEFGNAERNGHRGIGDKLIGFHERAELLGEMRRVLIDYARGHGAARRGGLAQRALFDEGAAVVELDGSLIALD